MNHGGSRVIIEDGEIVENEDEAELSFNWLEYLPTEASIRKSMEQLIRGYITMMEDEMNKGLFQTLFLQSDF